MKRNFGIDLMRAVSIWLVLIQHGGINIPGLAPLKIGGIGVEIFFVLSGFLIGGILFREIDKGNSFGQTLKSFWIRRWFRILPLYYAVLLFKFICIDSSIGGNILYYVFFLQNNFYGIQYLDVTWSLVIEEWFYIFTPIFLFAVTYFLKSEKKIIFAMIAFIVAVNVLRFAFVYTRNTPYEGINGNFPFRFDSLFLGVLVAFLKHRNWKLFATLSSGSVFTGGLFLFIGYIYYYWSLAYPDQLINTSFLPRTLGFFILPFTVALMVPYVSSLKLNADRNMASKVFFNWVNITSILTYSIYLVHPFIFALKYNLILEILMTYAASWIIYNYFEEPILKFRDRITGYGTQHTKSIEQVVK